MSDDVIFHLDEDNIAEDLEYYTTSVRDKHNQIKPSDKICSLTPHLSACGSFLTELQPYTLDRLYLGVSMPLFANTWGAAFLRELLKLIKPDGSIILPVYPEAEAGAKAYWCRSALEDIFRSRQLWTGFSNVNAENDGVMSMRVGRKFPDKIPSTACWIMGHISQFVLRESLDGAGQMAATEKYFFQIADAAWRSGTTSAICERILQNHFGSRHSLKVCEVGGYGFLAAELLCPDIRLTIERADVIVASQDLKQVQRLHKNILQDTQLREPSVRDVADRQGYDVVLVNIEGTARSDETPDRYWESVSPGGILLWRRQSDTSEDLLCDGAISATYYSYAAVKINGKKPPTHYSATMSAYINKQKDDKHAALQVFYKPVKQ